MPKMMPFKDHPLFAGLQALIPDTDLSEAEVPVSLDLNNGLAGMLLTALVDVVDTQGVRGDMDKFHNWTALNYIGTYVLFEKEETNPEVGVRMALSYHLIEDHEHNPMYSIVELYSNAFARYYGTRLGAFDDKYMAPPLENMTGAVRYTKYLNELQSDLADGTFTKTIERSDTIMKRYEDECGAVSKFFEDYDNILMAHRKHKAARKVAEGLQELLEKAGINATFVIRD